MKAIPVIDLLRGVAVHARRGERITYRPIRSTLVRGADPLALLQAYRRILGSTSVYVADLDAIMGLGDNRTLVAQMAALDPQLELFIDAGVRSAQDARSLAESGANKVVIASESVASLDDASEALGALGTTRGSFSIDMRNRMVLWRDGSTESRNPYEVAALLMSHGFPEAILLEMERIGTGGGADVSFLSRIIQAAPGIRFIVGGGIKAASELVRLKRAGASGVLLATALHDGTITRQDLIRAGAEC